MRFAFDLLKRLGAESLVSGLALAVPAAMSAVGQLGQDPGNTAGNLLGAAGSLGGSVGGGAAGGFLGSLSPRGRRFTTPLGIAAGSYFGGEGLGGLSRGVTDFVTGAKNSNRQEIKRMEQMARSQIAMESERALAQMPFAELQAALRQQELDEAAARELRARGIALYQQAMLGPSTVSAGAYVDPDYAASLAAIASRALG